MNKLPPVSAPHWGLEGEQPYIVYMDELPSGTLHGDRVVLPPAALPPHLRSVKVEGILATFPHKGVPGHIVTPGHVAYWNVLRGKRPA